jgi:urease accessory protein
MRATAVLRAGEWSGVGADTVLVDHDRRHRRRLRLTTEAGAALLLDLAEATHLRDGDGLALDDGRVVAVRAADEPLLEIHAHDADALARIAWHLGNRHLPVQFVGARLRIREDHVIADMVAGLGGHVHAVMAPFDPETGAYAGGHGHHHHHDDEEAP